MEYPALFEFDSYPRPYLIIGTDAHPFAGEEYIGVAVTMTDLDPAIMIQDEMWVTGGLAKQSYIKPWQPILLKHDTSPMHIECSTQSWLRLSSPNLEEFPE